MKFLLVSILFLSKYPSLKSAPSGLEKFLEEDGVVILSFEKWL